MQRHARPAERVAAAAAPPPVLLVDGYNVLFKWERAAPAMDADRCARLLLGAPPIRPVTLPGTAARRTK
jgi:hypothetical protein